MRAHEGLGSVPVHDEQYLPADPPFVPGLLLGDVSSHSGCTIYSAKINSGPFHGGTKRSFRDRMG